MPAKWRRLQEPVVLGKGKPPHVLSASAVRVHIAAIVRKLQVADRAAAAQLFRRPGT